MVELLFQLILNLQKKNTRKFDDRLYTVAHTPDGMLVFEKKWSISQVKYPKEEDEILKGLQSRSVLTAMDRKIHYQAKMIADSKKMIKKGRETIWDTAVLGLKMASELAVAGMEGVANHFVSISEHLRKISVESKAIADVLTAFTPGVNDARDLYELFEGKDLLSGEALNSFERSLALVGLAIGSGAGFWVVLEKLGRAARFETKVANRIALSARRLTKSSITFKSLKSVREIVKIAYPGKIASSASKFFKKATLKSKNIKITKLKDNKYRFEHFSPANNSGYGKRYAQEVDVNGNILINIKETIGPDGKVIETKFLED